jgi:hypothetical protein
MKNYKKLYEELRQAIDGGYALATHEDALEFIYVKREWVGLTDEEMLMIYGQQHGGKKYSLGRMVQQALKEKNT